MVEEKPVELPVSEQEVQIEAPSLLEKIQAQKKKILIGLGSLLGVLVLVSAVFGAYKLGQKQVKPGSGLTPTPEAVATPTPDLTANWETYTNTKYGFSIRYPKNYTIQEYGPSGPASIQVQLKSAETDIDIFWLSESPTYNMSLAEWYKNLLTAEIPYTSYGAQTSPEYTERKEIEIGGVKGIQLKEMGEHVDLALILLPIFDAVIDISVDYGDIEIPQVQQIFSTFKFLEGSAGEKVFCKEPRPEVCTMECITNPPYICGSDGKSYCTECQACANSKVEWYVIQDQPCE